MVPSKKKSEDDFDLLQKKKNASEIFILSSCRLKAFSCLIIVTYEKK